ncbi:MAG: DNA mismatch repair protein MutS [Thermoplasmata archaeon]|nr:DNA mismatch repair protein MutS [Thermoplasmata archaeon]
MMPKLTPIMEQYFRIKSQYKDALLFYRIGDFYETFDEDAKIVSRELEIVLTSRQKDEEGNRIPLAGVPYHALEPYLAKLVKKGYTVAICEQVEDPKLAKGIVKREVVRVVTPGTALETNILDAKANNYICSIYLGDGSAAMALADLSTGEFYLLHFEENEELQNIKNELLRYLPAECILPDFLPELRAKISDLKINAVSKQIRFPEKEEALKILNTQFGTVDLMDLETLAAGALLKYLSETQKTAKLPFSSIIKINRQKTMILDSTTLRNLEIVRNIRDGTAKGTVLDALDATVTAIGSRMLKKFLLAPLLDLQEIEARLDAVEFFVKNSFKRYELRELLKPVQDLERITTRISCNRCNPRDLIGLKNTLKILPKIQTLFGTENLPEILQKTAGNLLPMDEIVDMIERGIVDEPPVLVKEGGIIKPGFSKEVDDIRAAVSSSKQWIAELEARERERTGIKNLRIGYNSVFGYYIEVTKSYLSKVPEDYIRKQTLANAERFITRELKEKESLILNADERLKALEYQLFEEIRAKISEKTDDLLKIAGALATLDVFAALAEVAVNYKYTRPKWNQDREIYIRDLRHAVVERTLPEFIPNDVNITEKNRTIIITGPNMAGKSTYMRQIAVAMLMAQIGSFIPASYASLSTVDRIFTRVGAYDDLAMGQSTFMVEMLEVANILKNATRDSLIILDEIGRGTSTFDGMSLAWAVLEYIHTKIKARTLFATHYHQVTEIADLYQGIQNVHIAVKEVGGEVAFLRKVVPGATDRSYGIYVAKIAGVPEQVIGKAREILKKMEEVELSVQNPEKVKKRQPRYTQMLLIDTPPPKHPALVELEKIDINTLTPVEAFNILVKLKKMSNG